jgi:hypothetical protein
MRRRGNSQTATTGGRCRYAGTSSNLKHSRVGLVCRRRVSPLVGRLYLLWRRCRSRPRDGPGVRGSTESLNRIGRVWAHEGTRLWTGFVFGRVDPSSRERPLNIPGDYWGDARDRQPLGRRGRRRRQLDRTPRRPKARHCIRKRWSHGGSKLERRPRQLLRRPVRQHCAYRRSSTELNRKRHVLGIGHTRHDVFRHPTRGTERLCQAVGNVHACAQRCRRSSTSDRCHTTPTGGRASVWKMDRYF